MPTENPTVLSPMTTSQVAARFGVTTETVLNWRKRGLLRSLQGRGREYLFMLADVQAFEAKKEPIGIY